VGFNWHCGDLLVGWLRFVVSLFSRYPQYWFGLVAVSGSVGGFVAGQGGSKPERYQ